MVGEEDGEDRENLRLAQYMLDQARQNGKKNLYFESYPETGHLIDLPHCPTCHLSRHPYLPSDRKITYGGRMQPQALAQIQAWRSTLSFYKKYLFA